MFEFKVTAFIIGLLAIIIAGSIYSNNIITKSSKELENHVIQMQDSVIKGNWEKARTEFNSFEATWSKATRLWTILIDHNEIDNIDMSVSRLANLIKTRNTTLTFAEIGLLGQHIKHIPEKEAFDIKNVL